MTIQKEDMLDVSEIPKEDIEGLLESEEDLMKDSERILKPLTQDELEGLMGPVEDLEDLLKMLG